MPINTAHPTRLALIEAGLRLAEDRGLARMTVDAIVAEAKTAKGTFYVHFTDRASFFVALHQHFHDRLQSVMAQAMQGFPPGGERLQRGTTAYLDGCLHQRAVKALLLEARSEGAVAAEVQRRNAEGAALAQADFTAMNWPDSDVSARLFVAMVGEVVLSEVDAGHSDEGMRKTLWRFVGLAHE